MLIKNVVVAPLTKFVNQPTQQGVKSSSTGGCSGKRGAGYLGLENSSPPVKVGDTYTFNGFTPLFSLIKTHYLHVPQNLGVVKQIGVFRGQLMSVLVQW